MKLTVQFFSNNYIFMSYFLFFKIFVHACLVLKWEFYVGRNFKFYVFWSFYDIIGLDFVFQAVLMKISFVL